jgi:hypothetical protein
VAHIAPTERMAYVFALLLTAATQRKQEWNQVVCGAGTSSLLPLTGNPAYSIPSYSNPIRDQGPERHASIGRPPQSGRLLRHLRPPRLLLLASRRHLRPEESGFARQRASLHRSGTRR